MLEKKSGFERMQKYCKYYKGMSLASSHSINYDGIDSADEV